MALNVANMIDEYILAWNSHDVNKIVSFFTDDGIYEDVAMGIASKGKTEITKYLNSMYVDFPDMKFEKKSAFGTNDWMGIEIVVSGTHAHSSLPGVPATGKTFSVRAAGIYQIHKGMISRKSVYMNMVTFMQQVGLMPGQTAK